MNVAQEDILNIESDLHDIILDGGFCQYLILELLSKTLSFGTLYAVSPFFNAVTRIL